MRNSVQNLHNYNLKSLYTNDKVSKVSFSLWPPWKLGSNNTLLQLVEIKFITEICIFNMLGLLGEPNCPASPTVMELAVHSGVF